MRALGVLMMLPLIACSAGNAETGEAVEARGTGPSRDYDVAGFTAVSLRGADDVDVRVGSGFSVRAQGPTEELDRLEIVRDGDTLRVGRKRGGWSLGKSQGVKVFVTMPRIAAASVAGAGDMAVDRVEGDRFKGVVAGAGNLSLASVRVDRAELSVAGAGDLFGEGVARSLALSVAGAGDIDVRRLVASEADISAVGAGDVRATVNGPASVSAAGAGDVTVGGRARCTTRKAGAGDVRCG